MIHEDEDDIGYWSGAHPAALWRNLGSTAVCEALVPEWPSITEAGLLAHQGLERDAEKSRRRGGYGDLGTDPGVWSWDHML